MGYLSRSELEDLFLSGRFKKAATMVFIEIGGAPGYPVEAVIAGNGGQPLGECQTRDLETLLVFAEAERSNTGRPNPNLPIVKWAVDEMRATEARVKTNAERISALPTAVIIRFPTPLRVVP